MTTIAYDGRYLAADRLITQGNSKLGYACKLFLGVSKSGKDFILGVAGEASLSLQLLDTISLHSRGLSREETNDSSYEAFVIYKDDHTTVYEYTSASPYPVVLQARLYNSKAIGSGSSFALGAMSQEASAREAVSVACVYDIYSGGIIDCFDCEEWKFVYGNI